MNILTVKYLNPNESMYGECPLFALMRDGAIVATIAGNFVDENNNDTGGDNCNMHITLLDSSFIMSSFHALSMVMHTIMQAWGENNDSFESIFANGELTVNPSLYA